MKYRTRLKLCLAIILSVPILLNFMTFGLVGNSRMNKIEQNYGISMEGYKNWCDTTLVMDKIAVKAQKDLLKDIENGKLEKDYRNYVKQLNTELQKKFIYIIVWENEKFTYIGTPNSVNSEVLVELPIISEDDKSGQSMLIGTQEKYLVYPTYFKKDNGTDTVIYLIAETNRMLPEVENYMVQFRYTIFFIIIIMIACLFIFAYHSLVKPIRKLKKATQEIASGNLDIHISEDYEDELEGLCQAFEKMRIHLKEAVLESQMYNTQSRELISNISHDLKTPLTTIKGYAEGMLDGIADTPQKQEKYLKTIYNKANDMEHLIGELTVYSQIDTNNIPYHFIKLNVKEYFDDCVEDIQNELESRNFILSYFNYVSEEVFLMADPEQLHRVINNIIHNSIKYNNKAKGVINIRVREEHDYIHLEMEDNGKGVRPEEVSKIFDRFYRTDSSRNSKTGGSGIGLSIVKKIVEAHGGIIWAVSNENVGMTIHILLKKG